MKQMGVCDQHKGMVRLSHLHLVSVNELTVNPSNGRRAFVKHEAMVCNRCLAEGGYKEREKKVKKAVKAKIVKHEPAET